MKFKTTKKAMNANYNTVISIGYCDAQSLLNYTEPIAYSTRAEGWACAYYDINGVLISTGYAPINGLRNYEITKKYNEEAEKIQFSNLDYETKKTQVNNLLSAYVAEMINGTAN